MSKELLDNLLTAMILWSMVPLGIVETILGICSRGETRFGHYLLALLALLFSCLTLLLEIFLNQEKLPWLLP